MHHTRHNYGCDVGKFQSFANDSYGNLSHLKNANVDITYGYGYDALNRQATVTYPTGKVLSRTYTGRGQLETVSYDGTEEMIYYYDQAGRNINRGYGDQLGSQLAYNLDNTLYSAYGYDFRGIRESSLVFSYDANKRKLTNTDQLIPANNKTYAYDDAGRLTSYTRSNGDTKNWNLSQVGDWNSIVSNGTPESRLYNASHELTQIAATPLTYDVKGNLTQTQDGQHYTWDAENRLTSASVPANSTVGIAGTHSYAYDALGRRVSKTVNGSTTIFVSDGLQEICEYTNGVAPANPTRLYIFGAYIDEPLMMLFGGNKYYYGSPNDQYSPQSLRNGLNVYDRYSFDPYGNVSVTEGANGTVPKSTITAGNPWLFTGRRFDSETGLYYFRNRYYSPRMGRFVSRDPLGYPDGFNSYEGYFAVNGVDPLGLDDEWHHLLPKAIARDIDEYFGAGFLEGIGVYVHSKENGWILDKAAHRLGDDALHKLGWYQDWKFWFNLQKAKGCKITKSMIDAQIEFMKNSDKYKLTIALGKPATVGYYSWKPALTASKVITHVGTGVIAGIAVYDAYEAGKNAKPGQGGKEVGWSMVNSADNYFTYGATTWSLQASYNLLIPPWAKNMQAKKCCPSSAPIPTPTASDSTPPPPPNNAAPSSGGLPQFGGGTGGLFGPGGEWSKRN